MKLLNKVDPAPILPLPPPLAALAADPTLLEVPNFRGRAEALERLETLYPADPHPYATLQQQWETLDAQWFDLLRPAIRAGALRGPALRQLLAEYASPDTPPTPAYDLLDTFVHGLFHLAPEPTPALSLAPDMVFYQPTPVRVLLTLLDALPLTPTDVFYDLGSGLGHVPILVHLLTGLPAVGLEREPAYYAYARACADALHLPHVTFVQTDARDADFSEGTLFYLYTPFTGNILQTVLEKLKKHAQTRTIRLLTYGPCTAPVAAQNWLKGTTLGIDETQQGIFQSIYPSV